MEIIEKKCSKSGIIVKVLSDKVEYIKGVRYEIYHYEDSVLTSFDSNYDFSDGHINYLKEHPFLSKYGAHIKKIKEIIND